MLVLSVISLPSHFSCISSKSLYIWLAMRCNMPWEAANPHVSHISLRLWVFLASPARHSCILLFCLAELCSIGYVFLFRSVCTMYLSRCTPPKIAASAMVVAQTQHRIVAALNFPSSVHEARGDGDNFFYHQILILYYQIIFKIISITRYL